MNRWYRDKAGVLLGLLSACLMFSKMQAVENPCDDEDEYYDWYCCGNGSVNNPGTLSKTTDTICVGGSASAPTVSGTTFNNGTKCQDAWIDCESVSPYDTGTVTYTASAIRWDPAIPASFPNCGTFAFTAYIKGNASSVCGPTAEVSVGTYTVTVTAITGSGSVNHEDPIERLDNGTWINGGVCARIDASISYCGGSTATLTYSAPNLSSPGNYYVPSTSISVALSGSFNVDQGTCGQPTLADKGTTFTDMSGTVWRYTGWERCAHITWSITPGNCSATISVTQGKVF